MLKAFIQGFKDTLPNANALGGLAAILFMFFGFATAWFAFLLLVVFTVAT